MISLAHNDRSSYDNEIRLEVTVQTPVAFSELPVDIESTLSPCTLPNYATLVFNALHNSPKQTMSLIRLMASDQGLGKIVSGTLCRSRR
jgi:hypothetical protein